MQSVIDLQNTLSNKSHTVISKKMSEEFTTPFIDPFMGLGIFIENKSGQVYFSHGGDNEGFSGKFIGNKVNGDGMVILTNTNKPMFIEELIRSVATVYEWPNFVAPVYKVMKVTSQDFSNDIGRYQSDTYGFYKIYSEKGKLMAMNNVEAPAELIKVGDNTFALRDWDYTVKFGENKKTGKKELVQVLGDKTIRSSNPLMKDNEKTPLEMILEGHFEKGSEAYRRAKTKDTYHHLLSENYLNGVGYALLQQKELTKAIDIFRVNTLLYPNSENVFDSLGEAYLEAGEKEKAKQNYQKVLDVNPNNTNAANVLKRL